MMTTSNDPSIFLTETLEIVNKLGLHARAAAKLSKVASSFKDCEITLSYNEKSINAKSIMGVLCLAAGKGKKITFKIRGDRAQAAMDELIALVHNKFNESE